MPDRLANFSSQRGCIQLRVHGSASARIDGTASWPHHLVLIASGFSIALQKTSWEGLEDDAVVLSLVSFRVWRRMADPSPDQESIHAAADAERVVNTRVSRVVRYWENWKDAGFFFAVFARPVRHSHFRNGGLVHGAVPSLHADAL